MKRRLEHSYGIYMKKMLRKLTHVNMTANQYLFSRDTDNDGQTEEETAAKESNEDDKQTYYREKLEQIQLSITQADKSTSGTGYKGTSLIRRLEDISEFDPQTEPKTSIKSLIVKELTSIQHYIDSQTNMLGVTYSKKNENFLRELVEIDKKLELLLTAS